MLWCDKIAARVEGEQLINDSKTPSGRAHVGALRGVLIHDVVFRAIQARGLPVRYTFGVDDYDPLDELPAGEEEFFRPYLGVPLCQVPPPPGSSFSDISEHYIQDFFSVFRDLNVEAETYRLRDIYRSGQFNEAIDDVLRNAATVRRVYKEVSKAERPDNWYPFQAVCEQCGRIGTTEVSDYDGKEVTYTCRPDLVTWATGCGYRGKVSPFDGKGKLPWKLEWTAKWKTFPITIEGAGKDHTTKGGSRDVAAACLRRIFNQAPPLNIPYEFFLVGGAKMSSSKGLGVSARDMADFLPPEILRFVMIRTQPKQPVNFSPDEKSVIKIFNDFDRFHTRTYRDPQVSEDDKRVYQLAQTTLADDFYAADFQLVATIAQLPHLDLTTEIEKRKGAALTTIERRQLERRAQAARYWLEHYASPEERIVLQDTLPERAAELTASQRAFLHQLADRLPDIPQDDSALQAALFDTARLTPLAPARAFQAIYRTLLDHDSGPKAGNLLAFLDRDFLLRRFRELPYDQAAFWQETSIGQEEFDAWVTKHRDQIKQMTTEAKLLPPLPLGEGRGEGENQTQPETSARLGVVECVVELDDGRTHMQRVRLGEFTEQAAFKVAVQAYVESVTGKYERRVITILPDLKTRIWNFLETGEALSHMKKASDCGRPALSSRWIQEQILVGFGAKMKQGGWKNSIGKMVRKVMEAHGYIPVPGSNGRPKQVKFKEDEKILFTSATVYKKDTNYYPDEIDENVSLPEGAKQRVTVNRYERDPQLRKQCIAHYGTKCCICGFSFGDSYGEVAEGFIHVHHIKPLSEIGTKHDVNPVKDLRPVCPNCHAVIHRKGEPTFGIEEVKAFLQRRESR